MRLPLFLVAFFPILATAGHVLKARNPPYEHDDVSNANCERKDYYIESSANRTQFNLSKLLPQTNQSRITELFVQYATKTSDFTTQYITGTRYVSETFRISGILCRPKKNADDSRAIQLLVHGIAFDSFYWNFQGDGVPEQDYSYAYQAAKQGITTFRYDRLGTGFSQRPSDGYNTVQAATEVGVLRSIAKMLKQSTKVGGKKWDKVLLIGHSYGSVQSQALTYLEPTLVDGVILTGFSTASQYQSYSLLSAVYTMASIISPNRFGNIPPDWLLFGSPYSVQINFIYPPSATQSAITLSLKAEQPVTQGSLFTLGTVGGPAELFTGPVQVLTAQEDFIFTFDRPFVNGTSLAEQAAKMLYPASKNATSVTPGKTGHGINIHTTAKSIYKEMLNFAKSNNL